MERHEQGAVRREVAAAVARVSKSGSWTEGGNRRCLTRFNVQIARVREDERGCLGWRSIGTNNQCETLRPPIIVGPSQWRFAENDQLAEQGAGDDYPAQHEARAG